MAAIRNFFQSKSGNSFISFKSYKDEKLRNEENVHVTKLVISFLNTKAY